MSDVISTCNFFLEVIQKRIGDIESAEKRKQEVNKSSSEQYPFQCPYPTPRLAQRCDTHLLLGHVAKPHFELPPLFLNEGEVGMTWEKRNHSKDELLQGKSDQVPSSAPLLPALRAAPRCSSLRHVDVQQLSSGQFPGLSQNEPAAASETASKEGG